MNIEFERVFEFMKSDVVKRFSLNVLYYIDYPLSLFERF